MDAQCEKLLDHYMHALAAWAIIARSKRSGDPAEREKALSEAERLIERVEAAIRAGSPTR